MDRNQLRIKVRQLRQTGSTYAEIKKKLGVTIPKSTLSYWCKDINLPRMYKKRIKQLNQSNLKLARMKALAANKKRRNEYLESLCKRNLPLLRRLDIPTQKLILSILYLAEGAKHKSTRFLSLGSSDPRIIKFFIALLKNCYKISGDKFRARVQCRFDQDIADLEKFWYRVTEIKQKQFYPTYVDKRTKGKKTIKRDYKGVCMVIYFDTEIQLELELLASLVIKYIPS